MSLESTAERRDDGSRTLGDAPSERLSNDEKQLIIDLFTPAYQRLMGLSATAGRGLRLPRLRPVRAADDQLRREIVIVDDSRLSQECLQARLSQHNVNASCAWDLESLMAQLKRCTANVVLLNANSKDSDTLLHVALAQDHRARVVVFGLAEGQPEKIASYVDAGASAIHLNSETFEHLLWLINEDAKTDKVICSSTVSAILLKNAFTLKRTRSPAAKLPLLSPREKQILGLLEMGLSNQQIATRLNVTVHTVKNHVHKVLTKLEVSTRAEAVAYSRATELDLA